MGTLATENPDNDDMKELLKSIIVELKGIRTSIALQNERFEELSVTLGDSAEWDADSISKAKPRDSSLCPLRPAIMNYVLSVEMRTGPVLREAINRYQKNAIPAWSPLYGTHLARDEGPMAPEIALRNAEWASITGDCWKIPHDNRVTFCFLTPTSDITTLIQVRNFLSHFHVPNNFNLPKGEYFNIWDWFDTGISAYWCPGAKSPLSQVVFDESRATSSSLDFKTPARISHLVAPWRRIINLQGLTTISNRTNQNVRELSDNDLCPFFNTETPESIFQQPVDEMLSRAVKCHLRCSRALDTHHAELQTKDCILFHVTFFELLNGCTGRNLVELWPCGELHSDRQDDEKPRKIRESALTLFAIPCSDLPAPKGEAVFWTLVCLRPNQFPHPHYSEKRDDLFRGRTHRMIDGMGDLVHQNLLAIVSRWEEIAAYFDELLVEKKGLLDPEYHDSLLTDDGVFSRSKKYFWAVDFLKEAGTSITDNILQVQRFVGLMKSTPPLGDAEYRDFELRLKKFATITQKLDLLKLRFKNKREEATALRDGLFSASAVMESRAATQLGENIKLLTLVSIFFLPLSFCSSLWSINNTLFPLSALAVVMPAIGISTYVTVFYLNNIASFFSSQRRSAFVQQFISSQVNRMREDDSPIWRERGITRQNSTFQNTPPRVSYWRVMQFAMRRFWMWVWDRVMRKIRGTREREEWPKQNLGDIRVQVQVDVQTI